MFETIIMVTQAGKVLHDICNSASSCLVPSAVCSVLVYGIPHHQAVLQVEILGQPGDASVSEVIARLEGAVG